MPIAAYPQKILGPESPAGISSSTARDVGPLVPSDWWHDDRLPGPFPDALHVPGRGSRPEDWLCCAPTDVGENSVLLVIYPRLQSAPTSQWWRGPTVLQPEWLASFAGEITRLGDQATISRLDFHVLDRDPDDPRRGVCEQ